MPRRDSEPIPYRSAIPEDIIPKRKWGHDDANQDTLKVVLEALEQAMEALYKDFNAFDVLEGKSKKEAAEALLRSIEAKQLAFDILTPLYETVKSAIHHVEKNNEEG